MIDGYCNAILRRLACRVTYHRSVAIGIAWMASLAMIGCGKPPTAKPIHGVVTCNGEKAIRGRVTFIPLGVAGPSRSATIIDGQYRLVGHGVPLGKYRVAVDAMKATGRKVQKYNGMETTSIDEEVRISDETYAGEQSPLTLDVTAAFNGTFDITIPPSHDQH